MIEKVENSIENFLNTCKRLGLKITPQRLAVYEVLLNRGDHPTVEEIYDDVKKRYPYISLATVYRTVETLEDLGLVKKVAYWGSSARYDANTHEHHHLICLRCGAIEDLQMETGWQMPEQLEGYKTISYSIHIYGLCPACQKREPYQGREL